MLPYVELLHSFQSNGGYHAGYVKDNFGCTMRPCECAGLALKDKTVIGMDFKCTRNNQQSG